MPIDSRRVLCIGETVYDIIFKNGKPVDATPGGAMLNTSVSLGRMGLPVYLIGDFANDTIGRMMDEFLLENSVNTEFVTRYEDAHSRLALAFLNDKCDAEYEFYKIRKQGRAILRFPEPEASDIILFGSFYGIKEEIRPELISFLQNAEAKGSIIIYDPNFRRNHLSVLEQVMPFIRQNCGIASIVKGSDEDFRLMFGAGDCSQAYEAVSNSAKDIMLYTANKNGMSVHTRERQKHYCANPINPLSTVGAGDAFNAGLIFALYSLELDRERLYNADEKTWDEIIFIARAFAEEVCMSYSNFVSPGFAIKK